MNIVGNIVQLYGTKFNMRMLLLLIFSIFSFVHLRIPVLYQTMGTMGRVLCALFFLCLGFAGMTTQIANVQLAVVTLKDFGSELLCLH